MPPFEPSARPRRFHGLTGKLLAMSLLALATVLVFIVYALMLSWRLEGGAAAINDVGSLRMRSYRLSYLQSDQAAAQQVENEIDTFDQILLRLRHGDPARPLFLPDNPAVRGQEGLIERQWSEQLRPLLQPGSDGPPLRQVQAFVVEIDRLVSMVERDNENTIRLLRLCLMSLIAVTVLGTATIAYLLLRQVIGPLKRLSQAISRLGDGQLEARVEFDNRDEFGVLADGVNQMAGRLQALYHDLEAEVRDKTRAVEEKSLHLQALYDMVSFLHQPRPLDETGQGFIRHLMERTGADAASLRLVDPARGTLESIAQIGLPAGQAASPGSSAAPDRDTSPLRLELDDEAELAHCQCAGFSSFALFRIHSSHDDVGVLVLYFHQPRTLSEPERTLIETLGHHVGMAIESQRLTASGASHLLHSEARDNIVQSLFLLDLQAQMLEDALDGRAEAGVHESLAAIRAGARQCGEDMRGLLTDAAAPDFAELAQTLLRRFELQTRVPARLETRGDGAPLAPQLQLQACAILQEALSNIRRHAAASQVEVEIDNAAGFRLSIRDNGRGFDPPPTEHDEGRAGLSRMRQQARRINGRIRVVSAPEHGAMVELILPREAG
ncbi:type IV pili methyl-accepting chemotaxis transducer N-terminal domain-containing protein [Chromobacterium vaccinii]|uniref:type IV pili methyl-accepting chemotaxis transducer N-terminal domain-containing protein n=1 Tax=Chromobacterium vaccinii TaxID=1108595 RepID=UPI003C7174F8